MSSIVFAVTQLLLIHASSTSGMEVTDFPVIDLGCARHSATTVNTTTQNITYATYSNIRFAQPPTGKLRFKAPKLPPPSSEGIQNGTVPRNSTNCPQAIPSYFPLPGLNGTSWGSEDCLFLDVIVPEGIEDGDSVPVLHWIYGGGYFYGAKDNGGNPAALFEEMKQNEKFIVVASNYRLGALGWMSKEDSSMISNAGLYDSWAALQWTKTYISRFGGNQNQITVMGQSAGGGIIEHLLAADTQDTDVPFNQAILSSAGYRPHVNRSLETAELYQAYLNATNCSSIACLRNLSSEDAIEANTFLFQDGVPAGFPGPSISFGPLIDGDLVPDVPWRVLQHQKGGKVKRVIVGTMQNEGAASNIGQFNSWSEPLDIFARTPSTNTTDLLTSLYGQFNGSTSSFLDDGSVEMTPFDRFSGDIIFHCNAYAASKAYRLASKITPYIGNTGLGVYRYSLGIPPALHGDDLQYYFYDKTIAAVNPKVDPNIAKGLQDWLRRFILHDPTFDHWPEYGDLANPSWLNITDTGLNFVSGGEEVDLAEKCEKLVDVLANKEDGW